MIKISKKADYAVLIMASLSTRQAEHEARTQSTTIHEVEPTSAQEIADDNRLSRPLCANLLKTLTRASLLESVRGAGGGYRLALPSFDINLMQIIEAIDGPIRLVECAGSDHDHSTCSLSDHCQSQSAMRIVHERVANLLVQIQLPELSQQQASTGPVSGHLTTLHDAK
ncbi:MAG: Rrf2 family transcriptional regulator [Planctomycetota bacterium]|nr:Rrf2 family transcriptional regulator [Planctomycetota bacterium]